MDAGALIAAGIGAAGGAVATGAGAWYRNRMAVRSAARLIHAELTENTAAIRYFRKVGLWPATSVRHSAWDTYAETLSKMRRSSDFQSIQRGYSQLEGIAYLAQPPADGQELPPAIVAEILEAAIAEVREALRQAGNLARVDSAALLEQIAAMEDRKGRAANGPATLTRVTWSIPPSMQDAIVRADVEVVSETARTTLETMGAIEGEAESLSHVRRVIYDAGGSESTASDLPVVRGEGAAPTGDPAVDELYDGLGAFHRFFIEVFARDSIDGRGQPLEAVVHYGSQFSNMFWDGQRIVAGDGDGHIFKSLTSSREMVAAELSIGIVSHDSPFVYWKQPGALMQSLAGVFGLLVKQYELKQRVEEADWLIGADSLGDGIDGTALYSVAAPGTAYNDGLLGKDPQPATMDDYVETDNDNGGVHINSGIPSRAFYELATGLGGFAWERAGPVWYEAMRDPGLRSQSGFRRFARATVEAAGALYGETSEVVEAVSASWAEVGVTPSRPRAQA